MLVLSGVFNTCLSAGIDCAWVARIFRTVFYFNAHKEANDDVISVLRPTSSQVLLQKAIRPRGGEEVSLEGAQMEALVQSRYVQPVFLLFRMLDNNL